MKIAIHPTPGSYSDQWLEYFRTRGIETKRVNCLASDIVAQMADCDGLMWHWAHWEHQAVRMARPLILSLELAGKKVFPDRRTCWHYDDKIGQKYLLEGLGAPLVPADLFFDEAEALAWIAGAEFPKVFKLRRGAGSSNVVLVRTKRQARALVRRAFGRGFPPINRRALFVDRFWHIKRDRDLKSLVGLGKGLARLVVPTELERNSPREQGYAYFQDFVPGNDSDNRVVVIGNRAFGIRRMVRKNDFRASGSGVLKHAREEVDPEAVKLSFELTRKIGAQCLAYDYVFERGRPRLLEISYAFLQSGYKACPGYWDAEMVWHEGPFVPEWFMAEDFVAALKGTDGRRA
jgi:glutathione synthase/RimK-type ligase-like ATP-grasp enzyme